MSIIRERITEDMKTAMKAKDKQRLAALRLLKAEIIKKETESGASDLDEAGLIQLLQTMKKQRLDSIAQFEKGGRPELAEGERAEIAVLETYLPEPLDEKALAALVAQTARELGIDQLKDMGVLIKTVKAKVAGAADGKQISQAVKAHLSN